MPDKNTDLLINLNWFNDCIAIRMFMHLVKLADSMAEQVKPSFQQQPQSHDLGSTHTLVTLLCL